MGNFVEKLLTGAGQAIKILHLLRVQIVVALFALFAFPIGVSLHNGTFIGLCDAIAFFSLALITASLFLLSWTLHITTRLVLVYGPARYGIPDITTPPANPTPWRRFLHSPWFTLTIAAALPVWTLIEIWSNTECITALSKAVAITLGFVVAVIFLVISANLHDRLEARGGTTTEQMYPRLLIIHPRRGRTQTGRYQINPITPVAASEPAMVGLFENGQLRSGHRMAFIFLGFFLFFYVVFFFEGLWADYNIERLPAALFFVFLLITWITWMLSGLTFSLDRFHIPILTTLLISSLAYSAVFPKDHEFKVLDAQRSREPLAPREIVNAWEKTHPNVAADVPIIVVAAEGGGIEASAWTGLVLKKLEEATQHQLHNSIVLVSSVSGGSTGTYYYLDQFGSDATGHPDFVDKQAFENSAASSLGAAAWGLAYPDFFRTLPFLSSLVSAHSDRGYALERSWMHNHGTTDSLETWITQTGQGLRPAVIFNATGVETGQPVLFGTTFLSTPLPLFKDDQSLEQQFLLTFPKTDLAVSTAARMSAAFPYVSPEARPAESLVGVYDHPNPGEKIDKALKKDWDSKRLHVADGGLFDNTGVVSAVHWIYDLSQKPAEIHRPVVLLMITSPYQEKPGASWSWQHQLIGPVETLLHVRTGSQHVRRNLEAQLLASLTNKTADSTDNPLASGANAAFIAQKSAGPTEPAIKTFPPVTVLRFCNATDPEEQTLSWHLTKSQSNALQNTWNEQYARESAPTHAEVAALVHLLDPAQPDVAPSNICPAFPPRKAKMKPPSP